jgi:transposase
MVENNRLARTRRKRHSAEFKAEVVNACLQPGVSVAAVALQHGLNANMLRTWVTAYERALAEQNRAATESSTSEFIALPLAVPHGTSALPDIVVEVKRGAATVTVRWPASAAADCASWLHGWLR